MDRLLLCTDLDRTLLPNGPQPESEQARTLFARLAAMPGVQVVYVTGRDTGRVDEAIGEWNLPRPDLVIADVGATIAEQEGTAWAPWPDWDAQLAADWEGLTPTDLQKHLTAVSGLVLQEPSRQGRFKLSYLTPAGPEGEVLAGTVRRKLDEAGVRANVIWSLDEPLNKGLLDILPRAASKFLAIEHVRARLGHRREEVLFAGDSGNDLAVLASPLPAVLVANARDEIRSRARAEARSRGSEDQLHCATGGPLGLNGNYAAGILEGVLHYHPGFGARLEEFNMKEPIGAAAVVFGEVLFDRFPGGRAVLGGAPFNVAWNLKALQAEPLLVSRVGRDELGDQILAAMAGWEMDTRGLQVDGRHPTGTVEVTIEGGEPAYDIAADKAYDFIAPEALPGLGRAEILYHGSLALRCDLPRQTLARLRSDLAASVFLDVNLRAPWWQRQEVLELVARARWVKLNEAELAELVPDAGTIDARARLLLDRQAPECLIVTRGDKGVWFADRQGQVIQAPAPPAPRVVDAVGAGDAFSSVIMIGLLREWEWPVILERALAFAAAVVGLQGATTADRSFYASFTRAWEL